MFRTFPAEQPWWSTFKANLYDKRIVFNDLQTFTTKSSETYLVSCQQSKIEGFAKIDVRKQMCRKCLQNAPSYNVWEGFEYASVL